MRIAVIGSGGAGLLTAWLLEQDHQVTLFEKQSRPGGHADTVQVELDGRTFGIDAGFEFLSSEMFPQFTSLLRALEVPLYRYPMSATVYTTEHSRITILPPVRNGKILWAGIAPKKIIELLQLRKVLANAKGLMDARDTTITIEQFVESLCLSLKFKKEFLYPFLLAGWCVEPDEFRSFMAYNVLRYAYMHQPAGLAPFYWLDIVGGTQTYIQTLANSLTRTDIKLGTEIVNIRWQGNEYQLVDSQGNDWRFDEVVFASNAWEASRILHELDGAEPIRAQLDKIEYFKTSIAIHGDERLMPADKRNWSVVNIRYDGRHSSNSIWKNWRTDNHSIFKSWVTYEKELPQPLYALRTYWHAKINAAYFEAQKGISQLQGANHLWFAGVYTHDVDSHENAVLSAIQAAQRLAPHSARLKKLIE
jgi:predicted NAD/FAD-binding protein